MSIAWNEAEALWRPDPIYGLDYDRTGRIKAYVRGRTAKPCDEQVEAVARMLRDTFTWNHIEAPERVEDYRNLAIEILDTARKAVM